jgi:hypothetical protein
MTTPTTTRRSPERVQFLKDVLITAVEGGINYWGAVADYDPDAGTVTVYEMEEGEFDPGTGYVEYPDNYVPHKVTIETIAHGIAVLLEQRKGHDPKNYWHQFVIANRTNGEDGDYDAGQADDILQAGLFDTVVYA